MFIYIRQNYTSFFRIILLRIDFLISLFIGSKIKTKLFPYKKDTNLEPTAVGCPFYPYYLGRFTSLRSFGQFVRLKIKVFCYIPAHR